MANFDLDAALRVYGAGAGPLESLGIAFGVPQCLFDLTTGALGAAAMALLPSQTLGSIANRLQDGRDLASKQISDIRKKILLENGIFELDTQNGTFRFVSDFSKIGLEQDSTNQAGQIGAIFEAIGYATQFGSELYTNYLGAVNAINGVKDCLDSYKQFLDFQKGPAATKAKQADPNYTQNKYAEEIAQVKDATDFITKVDDGLQNIQKILAQRQNDPSLEPVFNPIEDQDLTKKLEEVGFSIFTPEENLEEQEPIFRLVFGPPKSKKGQFLLSIDGLYYDSQSGGLPQVSGYVAPELNYKFEHSANLGGKGTAISLKNINKYVDSIFDLNIIDESPDVQTHYDADHFLTVLKNQKNKNIYDLSSQIYQIEQANPGNTALLVNLRQSLISTIATHDSKINRRKKQIEVAYKAPRLYLTASSFDLGKVPINDFSYLSDIKLSIAFENQKKLILRQAEVSGVVLPLTPKYVKAIDAEKPVNMNHLIVPSVGVGAIIFDKDSYDETPTVLSLTDIAVKNGLFAVYNFLDGKVTNVGSTEFNILNCADTNNYNNAQLVSDSLSSVFVSGLAIPKLTGICTIKNDGTISSVGSFVKLPDTQEFQNLTYGPKGFTIESWIHLPDPLTSYASVEPPTGYGVSTLHRILLGCENIGGENLNENAEQAGNILAGNVVRGMLLGFTRDRQVVSGLDPSDSTGDNNANDTVFYLAPTRSVNASDVGFINYGRDDGCVSGFDVTKCCVSLKKQLASGKYVSSVANEFMHFVVTINPEDSFVKIYVDGELMATSSTTRTFGIDQFKVPEVPSFYKDNSFEYSLNSTSSFKFKDGPKLNEFFTPWIIGGGYTDGNIAGGGFLGSHGGKRSGLNGYVGSMKFYNRPLTNVEVISNFDYQKGFFKNIST